MARTGVDRSIMPRNLLLASRLKERTGRRRSPAISASVCKHRRNRHRL